MRRPYLQIDHELTAEELRGLTYDLRPTGRDQDGATVYELTARFRWWFRLHLAWCLFRHLRIRWTEGVDHA